MVVLCDLSTLVGSHLESKRKESLHHNAKRTGKGYAMPREVASMVICQTHSPMNTIMELSLC